jgi:hypothetical protein
MGPSRQIEIDQSPKIVPESGDARSRDASGFFYEEGYAFGGFVRMRT